MIQKLSDLSHNEDFLKISVEELNEDLKRKTEPREREAGPIRKRLDEIDDEGKGFFLRSSAHRRLLSKMLEVDV